MVSQSELLLDVVELIMTASVHSLALSARGEVKKMSL